MEPWDGHWGWLRRTPHQPTQGCQETRADTQTAGSEGAAGVGEVRLLHEAQDPLPLAGRRTGLMKERASPLACNHNQQGDLSRSTLSFNLPTPGDEPHLHVFGQPEHSEVPLKQVPVD